MKVLSFDIANSCNHSPVAKKVTTDQILERLRSVHSDTYILSGVSYVSAKDKVTLICREHGEFSALPANLISGTGCPTCAKGPKTSFDEFVTKSRATHGDRYEYLSLGYSGVKDDASIVCATHGVFRQQAYHHMRGHGCKHCASAAVGKMRGKDTHWFIAKSREVHGDVYDYSLVKYETGRQKVMIGCSDHGTFAQTAHNHTQGQGCPKCSPKKQAAGRLGNTEDFVLQAKNVHGEKYGYDASDYVHSASKIEMSCPTHGVFWQAPHDHLDGHGCSKCASYGNSKPQLELYEFVKDIHPTAILNHRIGSSRKEIDVYIPELNLGFEYDGIPWHSDWKRQDHLNMWDKHKLARENGIRVINIFSDEWSDSRPVVEKTIAHVLGKSRRVFGRSTIVVDVSADAAADFLTNNHIQGAVKGCSHLGLMHKDDLVALMSFSSLNSHRGTSSTDGHTELRRYSSTCAVVGGASKLFKAYLLNNDSTVSVTSYSDNRMFAGGMYNKLGFTKIGEARPDYFYVRNPFRVRHRKGNFTRDKLALVEGFDPLKTEKDNMIAMGWSRIYDCGKTKWLWTRPT